MTSSPPVTQTSITKSEHVKDDGLSEIYQSVDLRYALLRPEGEDNFVRITPWAKCRDFIGDVYVQPKAFEIYGCHFDPAKEKLDKRRVCLALKFPKKETKDLFLGNIHLLNNIELGNEFAPTFTLDVDEKTTVTIGDGQWAQNVLTLSLYTALLRFLCYELGECGDEKCVDIISQMRAKHARTEDGKLVKSVDPKVWESVLTDLKSIFTADFCGFDPEKEGAYNIHHNSGFFSIFGTHRELDKSTLARNTHHRLFKEKGFPLPN